MGAKKRRILSLPVAAVISLMITVYYTTIFVFLQDWMGLTTPNGIVNALIFTFSALAGLIAFFVAVLTDPGRVPFSFAPEAEDPQKNVCARYCDKCRVYKPPRSHHCRVCKRCVLKMDHHCVWISNCVGFANYKAYIIFIFHAAICSIYSTVIFCCSVTQKDNELRKTSVKLYYVLYGTVTVGLSLTMGSLLAWHIYLLIHNMTTIEGLTQLVVVKKLIDPASLNSEQTEDYHLSFTQLDRMKKYNLNLERRLAHAEVDASKFKHVKDSL